MNKLNSRRRSTKGADVVVEEQLVQEEQAPMMLDMPGMRMVALYGDLDEKKGNDIISDLFSLVEMKNILEKQLKTMDAKTKKQVLPQLSHKPLGISLKALFCLPSLHARVDGFGCH